MRCLVSKPSGLLPRPAVERAYHTDALGVAERVRLVHRRDELRASKIMAERVKSHPKIEVIWNAVITKLLGDRKSGITGVEL